MSETVEAVDISANEIDFMDSDKGFVAVHTHDEKVIKVLNEGNFDAWESLVKTMIVIRHNETRSQKLNDDIRKEILKVYITNVVGTYNGHAYLACQVITGGVNIGMAFLAASPQTAKSLGGRVFDMSHWDVNNPEAMRQLTKTISSIGKNISNPPQMAGQVCNSRDESHRNRWQTETRAMENIQQTEGSNSGNSKQSMKELFNAMEQHRQQGHQVAGAILS